MDSKNIQLKHVYKLCGYVQHITYVVEKHLIITLLLTLKPRCPVNFGVHICTPT